MGVELGEGRQSELFAVGCQDHLTSVVEMLLVDSQNSLQGLRFHQNVVIFMPIVKTLSQLS